MKKLFFVMLVALALICVSCSSSVDPVALKSISVEPINVHSVGYNNTDAKKLNVTYTPANASEKGVIYELYTSDTTFTDAYDCKLSDMFDVSEGSVKITNATSLTDLHFSFVVKTTSKASADVFTTSTVWVNYEVPALDKNAIKGGVDAKDASVRLFTYGNNTTATVWTTLADYECPELVYSTATGVNFAFSTKTDTNVYIGLITAKSSYGEKKISVSSAIDSTAKKEFTVYVNQITTATELVEFLSCTDTADAYLANDLKIDETLKVNGTKKLYLNGNTIDFTTNTAFNLSGDRFDIENGSLKQEVSGTAKMFTGNDSVYPLNIYECTIFVTATDEAYVTDIKRGVYVNGGKYEVNATTATVFKTSGGHTAEIKSNTDVSVKASKSAIVADAQNVIVKSGTYTVNATSATVFKATKYASIDELTVTVNAENAVVADAGTIIKGSNSDEDATGIYNINATNSVTVFKSTAGNVCINTTVKVNNAKNAVVADSGSGIIALGKYEINATSATVFKANDSVYIKESTEVTVTATDALISGAKGKLTVSGGKYTVNATGKVSGFECINGSEIANADINLKGNEVTAVKFVGGSSKINASKISVNASGNAKGIWIDGSATVEMDKDCTSQTDIKSIGSTGKENFGILVWTGSTLKAYNGLNVVCSEGVVRAINNKGTLDCYKTLDVNVSPKNTTDNEVYAIDNSGTINFKNNQTTVTDKFIGNVYVKSDSNKSCSLLNETDGKIYVRCRALIFFIADGSAEKTDYSSFDNKGTFVTMYNNEAVSGSIEIRQESTNKVVAVFDNANAKVTKGL